MQEFLNNFNFYFSNKSFIIDVTNNQGCRFYNGKNRNLFEYVF